MSIVVINLARCHDRRDHMRRTIGRLGLPFEFFPAVDASQNKHVPLSRYDKKASIRKLGGLMTPGELACFASHHLLWQRCAESNQPLAILEDDVIVTKEFSQHIAELLSLVSAFHLIRLGDGEHPGQSDFPASPVSPSLQIVRYPTFYFGTQGYSLTTGRRNASPKCRSLVFAR